MAYFLYPFVLNFVTLYSHIDEDIDESDPMMFELYDREMQGKRNKLPES